MIEILKNTKIDFIGKRYIAYVFSSILIAIGIIGIIQIARGKANLGIEFAGGTLVSVKFEKEANTDEIRNALAKAGLSGAEIQHISSENKFLIRIKKTDSEIGKISEAIQTIFTQELPGKTFVIDRSEEVGPAVGKNLQQQAIWAIFWAMVGITIYITWRFEFTFGIAAAIATLHDVIVLIGIIFLLNKEFTLLIITALLTIAGYSLTDTVVVFDRIRENLKFRQKENIITVFNKSINEVLSRTVITSLTTVLAVIALLFLGGEVIHDFAFALLCGILIGTYSSVFVASPIVVELHLKKEVKKI